MPYKDPDKQREYQRNWIARRRAEWFAVHGPCVDCGSWEDLELDHIDPAVKVTHRIWSWSQARRDAELVKCVARCHDCHSDKTRNNGDKRGGVPVAHGEFVMYDRGCRCKDCTQANTLRVRNYRAKR